MHGGRSAYYVHGEGYVEEPPAAAPGARAAAPVEASLVKFGRLFARCPKPPDDVEAAMVERLTELGECMNDPTACAPPRMPVRADESDIPSGYTYLGQFLAHEITFDDSNETLKPDIDPHNLRTPQIDLDSLYGGAGGPRDRPDLYEDGVRFKVGSTSPVIPPGRSFRNDLPRAGKEPREKDEKRVGPPAADPWNPKRALVGDMRNDENLALAQTHVAFLRFHNRVADQLESEGHNDGRLFECARREVVRHFQWVILYDYLPRLVDNEVLYRVLRDGPTLFQREAVRCGGPLMPLEFSAAAFRIGHTMVRASYEWNRYHNSESAFGGRVASVLKLFELTGFRRSRGAEFNAAVDSFTTGSVRPAGGEGLLTLPSDWIIDWRRFYDFPCGDGGKSPRVNKASRLDTILNFQLDKLEGFPDAKGRRAQEVIKAITVRNLLRGFYLGLPTGEQVARALKRKGLLKEGPLTFEQIADGPHKALLGDPLLRRRTPLWYYILKEAELLGKGRDGTGGHRLGPVGSRLVAETLVGLLKLTAGSILAEPGWRPRFGSPARGEEGPAKFEMTDLLNFAFDGEVNPLG